MAHNCIANVELSIDNKFGMIARTTVPVKRGEILFISYSDVNQGTRERRYSLSKFKYFECNCVRCCDPTECQTYLSALKCQKCSEGNVLPMKPLDHCSDWKCDHCSHRLTYFEVDLTIFKLQFAYKTMDHNDVESIESFMQSFSSLVHPNHYVFTKARRSLNRLYGSNPPYRMETVIQSPVLWKRKLAICQKLLSVDDVLRPGLSVARAWTLGEMCGPFMLQAKTLYQKKYISQEEYQERIQQGREIREESIRILSLEPAESAEGMAANWLKRDCYLQQWLG